MTSRWPATFLWALGAGLAGCGGDEPSSTGAIPPPLPSFRLACDAPEVAAPAGCASSGCTVTQENASTAPTRLSCAGAPPGITCGFGPSPVSPQSGASVRVGFTLAADLIVPAGTYPFEVVAQALGVSRRVPVRVTLGERELPRPARRSTQILGCAGYVEGVVGTPPMQAFRSVFVGAWSQTWGVGGCGQTLSESDGSFALDVPWSCVREGEPVYLTAGGFRTCVSPAFTTQERSFAILLGRPATRACP